VIGLATSFDFPDMAGMNSAVASVCNAITARPGPAATVIDRMQKMLNEKQQKIQQRFPRTFVYVTKQENKDKLKAGGDNCKNYFDGLRAPLSADLQDNKEPFHFMQQMIDQHVKDFINEIQQASG
jgi:alcohol dehydrogenase YqhD (iron-dependent ADH family)